MDNGLDQVNIYNHIYACNKTFSFDINNGNAAKILGKYEKTVLNYENDENDENDEIVFDDENDETVFDDENDETLDHSLKYVHYFKSDTNEETKIKSNFASLEETIDNAVKYNDCLKKSSSCPREVHNKLLCFQNCEIFGVDELTGNLTMRADIANYCNDLGNHFNDISQ